MASKKKLQKKNLSNTAYISIFIVIGAVLIFGSIMLGKSDNGEIDVSSTIESSNQANIDSGGDAKDNVGTIPNALKDLPNGGLVPQDSQDTIIAPDPKPSIDENSASGTASSTDLEEDSLDTEEEVSEETPEEPEVS